METEQVNVTFITIETAIYLLIDGTAVRHVGI